MTPRSETATSSPVPRSVCLFAEFHPGGRLPRTTLRYLDALRQAGFEVHAALSGTDAVDPEDASRLERIGVRARTRRNAGLDFGAWQDLIRDGVADGADEVLLANDSVFGPFAPLAPIVRSMAGFDAWGMVESREGRPHLQSWFVWMSGAAFRKPAVARVFAQPFATMAKPEIIVHGELGLAAAFEAEALDVGARYRSRFRIRPSSLLATNPMHFRWRRLLSSGAVPFVKIELLRDNPSRIIGIEAWQRVLEMMGVSDTQDIHEALMASRGSTFGSGRSDFPSSALGPRQALLQFAIRDDRVRLIRDLARHRNAGRR